MGERMTRWLSNPEKTLTILNKYRTNLKKSKHFENNLRLQGAAAEIKQHGDHQSGEDSPDFLPVAKAVRMGRALLSPFPKFQ